jgi:ABC-2 type transport system permease protein
MNSFLSALKAEFLKCRHAKISLISFITFALVPVMAGIFMFVMRDPKAMEQMNLLNVKVQAMGVTTDWNALFMIMTQGMGVGGIIIYGFLVSWIFGREYSENTLKDLLSLPTSKIEMINAKFIIYFLWAIGLGIVNLFLGLLIGLLLQLSGFSGDVLFINIKSYFFTMMLTILLGTPIAFFSMLGRGYLAPLGVVVLATVFSQIATVLGIGEYFPWALPALYSGINGNVQLTAISYILLAMVSLICYCITILYWKNIDYSK